MIDANFWAVRAIAALAAALPKYGLSLPFAASGGSSFPPGFFWGNDDKPASDGKVHDPERTAFLDAYLKSLRRASEKGVPLKGYFHWSLLDNFEWTQGFNQRFGLIYVDYKTQKRILKDSAARYTQIIRSQGATL